MAKKPTTTPVLHRAPGNEPHALYLRQKNGWFWVVGVGQRSIYYGPYATQAATEAYKEDIDTYHYDSGDE